MIYIDAVGENNVTISKPIKVSLPTDFVNPDMQLFKGENVDSSINWTDPKPLTDSAIQMLTTGKTIFEQACATCHSIDKKLTGPPLAHIGRLRPKQWLIDVVRNPVELMSRDCYLCRQKQEYGVIMQAFPVLDDKQISAIYAYLNAESDRLKVPLPEDAVWKWADTCKAISAANALLKKQEKERTKLLKENDPQVVIDWEDSSAQPRLRNEPLANVTGLAVPELINPDNHQSEYYQFQIEAFGWYNIDIFMKEFESFKDATLVARLTGAYKVNMNVFLAIPDYKVFVQGGKLTSKQDEYGFYTPDGKIRLPLNATAYVFVLGELKGQLLFDYKKFKLTEQNFLEVASRPANKTELNRLFKKMSLGDLKVQVEDSKNATNIRELDKKIAEQKKKLNALSPVNCNCDCAASDTTKSYYISIEQQN